MTEVRQMGSICFADMVERDTPTQAEIDAIQNICDFRRVVNAKLGIKDGKITIEPSNIPLAAAHWLTANYTYALASIETDLKLTEWMQQKGWAKEVNAVLTDARRRYEAYQVLNQKSPPNHLGGQSTKSCDSRFQPKKKRLNASDTQA